LQRTFLQYKLIFNNTNSIIRYNQQSGIPYTPPQGGLLTLINNKYAYPNNITKILTNPNILPYLQIIKLTKSPFTTILILHLYMPSHHDNLQFIPDILQSITHQISKHQNDNIILCGDFN
jgi:hypothetical protein